MHAGERGQWGTVKTTVELTDNRSIHGGLVSSSERRALTQLGLFATVVPLVELSLIRLLSLLGDVGAGFAMILEVICLPLWPSSVGLVGVRRDFSWQDVPALSLLVLLNLMWWLVIASALIWFRRVRGRNGSV